jgi:hypothetical protein
MVATRDLKSLVFTDVRVRVPSLVLKSPVSNWKRGFSFGYEHLIKLALWQTEFNAHRCLGYLLLGKQLLRRIRATLVLEIVQAWR